MTSFYNILMNTPITGVGFLFHFSGLLVMKDIFKIFLLDTDNYGLLDNNTREEYRQ